MGTLSSVLLMLLIIEMKCYDNVVFIYLTVTCFIITFFIHSWLCENCGKKCSLIITHFATLDCLVSFNCVDT